MHLPCKGYLGRAPIASIWKRNVLFQVGDDDGLNQGSRYVWGKTDEICILVVELERFSAGLMSVARKREVKNDYMTLGLKNCTHKAAIY